MKHGATLSGDPIGRRPRRRRGTDWKSIVIIVPVAIILTVLAVAISVITGLGLFELTKPYFQAWSMK